MNLSNKLNLILKDYSLGNKTSAYKRFKKIYLQNNKDVKLRYNTNMSVLKYKNKMLQKDVTEFMYKAPGATAPRAGARTPGPPCPPRGSPARPRGYGSAGRARWSSRARRHSARTLSRRAAAPSSQSRRQITLAPRRSRRLISLG